MATSLIFVKAGSKYEDKYINGATHFLEQTSYEELEEFTLRVLDMFSPNLILGISDEISPIGDIEKLRLVSGIVADYNP